MNGRDAIGGLVAMILMVFIVGLSFFILSARWLPATETHLVHNMSQVRSLSRLCSKSGGFAQVETFYTERIPTSWEVRCIKR